MKPNWDEQEALGQTADLLVECGERGQRCWALQMVLDEVIEHVGAWWLAHFIATASNPAAAQALKDYLRRRWPAYADAVEQEIAAANWTQETSHLAQELGEG